MKTKNLRKVSEINNIAEQKKNYRKFIETAVKLEEAADRVFGLVEDQEIVRLWSTDPVEAINQPDEEIREAAAMLYTAAQAVDKFPYKWGFKFEEYECFVEVGDFFTTPF